MPRHLNLRQIEAFKAVIENGTISRAADILHISQPAMSKLISHLEFDTGLRLFDRVKGRLAPTENGMRLYEEVDRIFAGVRQVESAVDAIRREEQGRLAIGVMPALSASFIQRVAVEFLREQPKVFYSVRSLSSEWIVERLVTKKLDVGLVSARVDNPYVTLEPLMQLPLVCIMPPEHPLASLREVSAKDLDGVAFVAFHSEAYVGYLVEEVFKRFGVRPETVLEGNIAPTICEFVAAGLGVSLVHPLMASGLEGRIAVRPFKPDILYSFQLCRSPDTRNSRLVEPFVERLRESATRISNAMIAGH